MYEVSLAYKLHCLRIRAKHTDLILLTPTTTLTKEKKERKEKERTCVQESKHGTSGHKTLHVLHQYETGCSTDNAQRKKRTHISYASNGGPERSCAYAQDLSCPLAESTDTLVCLRSEKSLIRLRGCVDLCRHCSHVA